MSLYVGKTFTVTVTGSVIKPVTCERCQKEYFYELARTAQGSGTAPYYINQSPAQRRAEVSARKNLQKRLNTEHEAVACPHCGWVQETMIRHLRKRRLRWLFVLVLVAAAIALGILGVIAWGKALDDRLSPEVWMDLGGYALLVIIGAGALLSVRWMIAQRIDPNRNYPHQRAPRLPGTPPALVKQMVDGIEKMVPVEHEAEMLSGEWLELQLQRTFLPPRCCICMSDTGGVKYQAPLSSGLEVPMCSACRRKSLARWTGWALLGVVGAAALAAALALGIPDLRQETRWSIFAVAGIFLAVVSLMLPVRMVRIYRVKTLDRSRGVSRLWFASPQYTRLVADTYQTRYSSSPDALDGKSEATVREATG